VAIGDRIESGQVVVEVETDKATVEVEADQAGRLARIVAQAGDVVPVKGPIAYLAASDADVDAYLAAGGDAPAGATASGGPTSGSYDTTPGRAATPSRGSQADRPAVSQVSGAASGLATAPSAGGRVKASPAARQVARKRGIDLATVGAGSGPGGRVLSTDVLSAASAAPAGPVRRPMTKMRRAIARNLQASKQTVPHFYMRLTVDAEPLLARYRQAKAQFPCSLNDLLTQAVARTVREFPAFRSRIEGEDVVEWPSANIGIAVGTDEGLTVPVLVGADRMDLPKLAAETRRVVDAARNGQLEGLGQGVFTISNLGMFGVEEFSAIINPPESAILAVGAIREDVVVENGAMRPGKVMTMTLSCDHRVVDGVAAAKFVGRLREMLTAREGRE
jgi:pyruvate dehydrogenase E2 component (dihydrolipoamide acetyltransferase)